MTYILDTNVLMEGLDISRYEDIIIPMVVLEELDNHSHSTNSSKSFKARQALKALKCATNVTYKFNKPFLDVDTEYLFSESINDNNILLWAYFLCKIKEDCTLLTYDLNMFLKAQALGVKCDLLSDSIKNIYKGYKEVFLTDDEISDFYSCMNNNFDLIKNEYLVIHQTSNNNKVIDCLRWVNEEQGYVNINDSPFKSTYLGVCNPLSDDFTQKIAFDSLRSTDITVLFGKPGAGKTFISLSFLMSQLKNRAIQKIYIVHSFEPLKENRTLGYLPGTKEEKILNSGLGNILSSKFGDIEQTVKSLMSSGKMEIIPSADIRGVEFDSDSALFVTEAQNLTPYTMKTLIQRCKSGCKIIIEGDMLEQTDINSLVNGMDRLIEVFKGTEYFSCVKLLQNHRNPIGEIAQKI